MIKLDEFRAGRYGIFLSCADELPAVCFTCVYLCHEESSGCLCDSPFYYFCANSWPDRLTQNCAALPGGAGPIVLPVLGNLGRRPEKSARHQLLETSG